MLNFRALCVVLTCSATLTALVYNVPSSTMNDVTVGGSIAEVSRSFALQDIPSGFHTIVLNHLPDGNTVDEKSIQVTGVGNAEVVSTTVQNQAVHRDNDREFAALSAQLAAVQQTVTSDGHKLNLEHAKASKRILSMNTYMNDVLSANSASSTQAVPLSLEKLTETLDYQEKVLDQYTEKIALLDQKINASQACLAVLKGMATTLREYGVYKNTLSSVPDLSSDIKQAIRNLPTAERTWPLTTQVKELYINIRVPGEHKVEKNLQFTVDYMTSPAAWHAEYDIRLDKPSTASVSANSASSTSTSAPAAITTAAEYELHVALYASVAQSTREDWTDVQLHLSTAQPDTHIFPPTPPQRQAITFQQEVQPMMYESMGARGGKMMHKHAPSFANDMNRVVRIAGGSSAAVGGDVYLTSGTSASGSSASIPAAPQMEIMADMAVAEVDMSGQAGALGSTVVFSPPHVVNITSNHINHVQNTPRMQSMQDTQNMRWGAPVQDSVKTRTTRLFIKEVLLKPSVFTYVVPTTAGSRGGTATLKAWTLKSSETGKDSLSSSSLPLLESPHGRVFIADSYTGTTTVPATQPGAALRLDLGTDRNIHITSTYVLPRQGSQSEDKVGWFVTDKVKYKVEVVEYAFTVKSTYDTPHLVVMSEYLPHVGEEGIKVELLQPTNTIQLGDKGQDVWSEEDFLAAVLAHPTAQPDYKGTSDDNAMRVYLSKGSHNIVYAQWVQPNQTLKTGLKYRIIWPDGKNINKQVHY